jgi:hypothetical protein
LSSRRRCLPRCAVVSAFVVNPNLDDCGVMLLYHHHQLP